MSSVHTASSPREGAPTADARSDAQVVRTPRTANAPGVISIVIGVIAFGGSWFPHIGFRAIPIAALGFFVGGLSLFLALRHGRGRPLFGVLGMIVSVAAVPVAILAAR